MTKRRGRPPAPAGRQQSGRGTDAETTSPVTTSAFARLLGDHFYSLLLLGGLLTGAVGWVLAAKLKVGTPVSPLLFGLTALGVVLLMLPTAAWLFVRPQIRGVLAERRNDEEARVVIKAARRSMDKDAAHLDAATRKELETRLSLLDEAQRSGDPQRVASALGDVEDALDEHLPKVRKATSQANIRSIVLWVLAVLLFRSFVAEAFKIPSGSMIPTLQVGDQIFVNKFIYGLRVPFVDYIWPTVNWKFGTELRKPRRGEVAVFKYPQNPNEDFIKRIVAIGGDTVEIKDDVVVVNGVPTPRTHLPGSCEYDDFEEQADRWQHRLCEAWQETLDGHTFVTYHDRGTAARSWAPVKVPVGSVFMMGDNRDNSNDSRFWGFVPEELLRGKAMVIWWSSGEPEGIRLKRFFKPIE